MTRLVQQVARNAVVTSSFTIADCPIVCTCWVREDEKSRLVVCEYYKGSFTTAGGSQVVCLYTGG